jgi:GR25 family glycosyltransferase involved in LPS biosynthesis
MLPDSFEELMKSKSIMLMLKRYQHRAEYSRSKLESVGFQVEFFEGVDGFTEDLESVSKELNVKIMSDIFKEKGSTGFTLSCVRIWKKIIDENLRYLIVFEDDALPHPNFKQIANEWYSKTDKDIDLLYLGSQSSITKNDRDFIIRGTCFCTHAYVITNKGARKLMNLVAEASNGKGLDKGDCALIQWQQKGKLDWRIWNNKEIGFVMPYPVLKPSNDLKEDAIWIHRDNGLIYQNALLGSTIHCLNLTHY